jgi:hypothetical protein
VCFQKKMPGILDLDVMLERLKVETNMQRKKVIERSIMILLRERYSELQRQSERLTQEYEKLCEKQALLTELMKNNLVDENNIQNT